jgi:hypothetical protein
VAISSTPARQLPLPLIRRAGLTVSVALIALGVTWTYLGMRAVMDIGGACASGGPYVPVQPCPAGADALLSVGIPVMVLSAFVASALAMTFGAPTLILPMWVALFGSLGWNFLEYAFKADDGVVIGWLVCGVMFEAMALPALVVIVLAGRVRMPGIGADTSRGPRWRWSLLYAVAGAVGLWIGLTSFHAWT